MDAAQIAQAGYRGMTNGKTTVIPGWRNKALAAAALLLPAGLVVAIVRGVLERKPPSATNM
jgi:short-subunit dehydrogenase